MKTNASYRLRRMAASCLICLLLALALPLRVRAAGVDIMFSDPTVLVGNSVTVNVYSTANIAGIDLTVVFDTDLLAYGGFAGGLGNAAVEQNGGSLHIVDYSASGDGRFSLDLRFTARAGGSAAVRPTACTVSDAGGDAMAVEYASHSSLVTITTASANCDLSALYIEPGTLTPAFSSGVTSYSVTVPNSASWLAVTPVKSDAAATYAISGNEWLNVGQNTVTITVTAGSGAKKTYTLSVNRQAAEPVQTQTTPPPAAPETTPAPTPEPTPSPQPDAVELPGGRYRFFEISRCEDKPDSGYTAGAVTIGDRRVSALLPETGGEYVLVYASPENKTPALYVYDTRERTLQRYGLLPEADAGPTPEPSPMTGPTPTPEPEALPDSPELEEARETIADLRWKLNTFLITSGVLFVAVAALGVALIRSVTAPGRRRK